MGVLDILRQNAGAAAVAQTALPNPPNPAPATQVVDPIAARRAQLQAEADARLKAELAALEAEDAALRAAATPASAPAAPTPILPPDAPVSGQTAPKADPIPAEQLATQPPAIQAAHAAVVPAATPAQTAPTEEPKKRRGRKPKDPNAVAAPKTGDLELYVDCPIISGLEVSDLDDFIAEINETLSTAEKIPDVRFAPEGSGLAFGKWKGAVAAVARANAPKGAWVCNDVAGSELRQVVVEALKPLCSVYVRGGR